MPENKPNDPRSRILRLIQDHSDENACWLWTGAMHPRVRTTMQSKGWFGKPRTVTKIPKPVISINGKPVSVVRALCPDLPRGVRIFNTCGHDRCVNLKHHTFKGTFNRRTETQTEVPYEYRSTDPEPS
ncbi:hypothetical protein IZ6_25360 [Terrihabitans soli]|uniref:Uncharacterized protein n=1 Tax=Terrihabitans soli TaxID=708113 RepID=A0A6S6QXP3_9HYPH|nr:hypothetical protein IZ6_25360 [Terrihabitans soli]